jgi:hypothetical protein
MRSLEMDRVNCDSKEKEEKQAFDSEKGREKEEEDCKKDGGEKRIVKMETSSRSRGRYPKRESWLFELELIRLHQLNIATPPTTLNPSLHLSILSNHLSTVAT